MLFRSRVNVSDILAKGARPSEVLLSIAWPKARGEADFQSLMTGIQRDLEAFDIDLIGGDLVGTDGPLTLTLTLTGACIGSVPTRRSGGRHGDMLWVSGDIGWGGLGLEAARSGGDPDTANRYRVPQINDLEVASVVSAQANASMDISDGLLIDAARLAQASECGVKLDLERIPLARPSTDLDAVFAQCTAGDDYQILLAAAPGIKVSGFTQIGELTESTGLSLYLQGQRVNAPSILGFEH